MQIFYLVYSKILIAYMGIPYASQIGRKSMALHSKYCYKKDFKI